MRDGESLDEDLDVLGQELRRLPTPMPPEALVSRVRRLAHLKLAGRADESPNRLVLAFLLLISWTVGLFPLLAVRLLSEETLLGSVPGSAPSWSLAYVVYTWISSTAALVLLGFHVRRQREKAAA